MFPKVAYLIFYISGGKYIFDHFRKKLPDKYSHYYNKYYKQYECYIKNQSEYSKFQDISYNKSILIKNKVFLNKECTIPYFIRLDDYDDIPF